MDTVTNVRRNAHDTEIEAAEYIEPSTQTLRNRVYELFSFFGPMTDEELMDRYIAKYGHIYKNSLEPRRTELTNEGLIVKTTLRRPGRSGVNRIVWMAV
jgi:hypothetical protein